MSSSFIWTGYKPISRQKQPNREIFILAPGLFSDGRPGVFIYLCYKYQIMVFEALECWWCLYLKSISTLTTMRKLLFVYGRNSSDTTIRELVMCPQCDAELPMSLQDQIKLIISSKPELNDWLTINPIYQPER